MNTTVSEATAAASVPGVASTPLRGDEIRRRTERLRRSALRAAVWFVPPFFLVVSAIAIIMNGGPDVGIVDRVVGSLVSGAFAAVTCAASIWVGLLQMASRYGKNAETLASRGRLVAARLCGRPEVYGGKFMTYVIGGALGAVWEPLAPLLGEQLPIFEVAYTFELDGRQRRACELFFADEAVRLEDDGTVWALVDPDAPHTRRWLLRERGRLQDAPFLPRT